jgi:hypothetical protein
VVDASALERYLDLLTTADETIDRETARALKRTQDRLADHAASIAHRQSGHMADTIHGLGPFAIGGGVLESQILSAAPYTAFELAKGDDHNWASRTLEDESAELDRLQEETGSIVATAIGGG